MNKAKHYCDNINCNHNDTKGLCCLFNPENCKYRQLQKENAELKDVIEGYKKIAKWCDKCDKLAELKSENQEWKDEWQEQVQKATDEGYARTLQTIQLNKAKEIIKKLIEAIHIWDCKNLEEVEAEAEQFLKDLEK